MRIDTKCLYCKKPLTGRTDKKYCDHHCKSAFQYQRTKNTPDRFYNKVDNQLRLNRKILKKFNNGAKVTVRADLLSSMGFNPNFFTHFWVNQKGDRYFFVYEYGFLRRKEGDKDKYILVMWQNYMMKSFEGKLTPDIERNLRL